MVAFGIFGLSECSPFQNRRDKDPNACIKFCQVRMYGTQEVWISVSATAELRPIMIELQVVF